MLEYNFDEPVNLAGIGSIKWENRDRTAGKEPVISLGVADMSFACPPEVVQAVRERAARPVYPHTRIPESYFEALRFWYGDQYGLSLEASDFLCGTGTIVSLGVAVRSFSRSGDGVLIATPVYGPFFEMIRMNGRQIVEAPMRLDGGGRYHFDRQLLGQAVDAAAAKGTAVPLALFCSPHNPGGAVWDRAELEDFLSFAAERNIIVACDEIHGDFVYSPKSFTSLASFSGYADRVVVISSPNKTFNLGGFHASHFVIRDKNLRAAVQNEQGADGFRGPDIFSLVAAETAYRYGGPWIGALKEYIEETIEDALEIIRVEIPMLRAWKPEGTYLIWLDASALITARGLKDEAELAHCLETEGRVKLSPGYYFGHEGRGFLRLNAACPRAECLEGVNRIKNWAAGLV
ncbi:MAG: aminotransferase class I/II-fold pyridoxal phosphate-dependent enzyme [Treponema sp.]|jgi:cystathionine beta-lyase|nr:aminotransferase class I/II-fold pyridoxal phosphate-dependent enzyme [Treponema sp.]